jgi:hypothetical protein
MKMTSKILLIKSLKKIIKINNNNFLLNMKKYLIQVTIIRKIKCKEILIKIPAIIIIYNQLKINLINFKSKIHIIINL